MPGTPPITSAAHSTSNGITASPSPAAIAALASMSLSELLDAGDSASYRTQDIWNTLVNAQTRAGKALLTACEAASPNGPLFLHMVTLLTTHVSERTVDRLADAGIFLFPGCIRHLKPDDAALLRSNKGLDLWLQYAAAPTAYRAVFDGSDLFGMTSTTDRKRIDKILRILVACGRDRTDASPSRRDDAVPVHPLSHLCSQIAPQWLQRLLELGAPPDQMNRNGTPLMVSALRAEALRLHNAGQDVMSVHVSLLRLVQLLKRHGCNLLQSDRRGAPAVALLALHGLCGAAEALLVAGVDPNAADANGYTLMHHLAHAGHACDDVTHSESARLAHYMLIVCARYGGDLNRPNNEGHVARAWLPASFSLSPPIDDRYLSTVRATALRRIQALS